MEKFKILYIDDEQNNLNGFKAVFRFDYVVLAALTTAQAKEMLRDHTDIRIILCDQRMPDQTGVQFFEEIRTDFPNPIRMLLTGYTDIESVIDGINRGHIFRYIKKPWTDEDVKSAIEEGNKFYLTNSLLAQKNEELQSAYDELAKFAYSVTHDMRGPLLGVMAAIEVIKDSDNLIEVKEVAGMMDVAVKQLDEFIINLHGYYNLKRGSLTFKQINFSTVVNEIASLFRVAGNMDNIRFLLDVSQENEFYSDLISVKIILNNLLSNAFKYQKKNANDKLVDIKINVSDNEATIVVQDNGIGIHEEYIEKIFTMFYRATSEETGSGFGLYNVKDAVARLNGQITVASTINEGTTFTVTIPGKTNASK